MSGSPVGTPPCVVERPGAKRGETTDRSVASASRWGVMLRWLRGLISVVNQTRREADQEGAEPLS